MPEETKFSKEEMKKINDIQEVYSNIQGNMGQLAISRLKLEQQLNQLMEIESNYRKEFNDTQNLEKEILEEINKKYGEGVLNTDTVVFTPTKK